MVPEAALSMRGSSARWLCLLPAATSLFSTLVGLEDDGILGVLHFLICALLCIAQSIHPIILG